MRQFLTLTAAVLVLLSSGCSITQYLPEGEYLYRGAELNLNAPDTVVTDELTTTLNGVLDNQGNTKYPLIGYRPVWRYYKHQEKIAKAEAEGKTEKVERLRDKDVGEEPIFYRESVVESVNELLENRSTTNGYFVNNSEWRIDTNYDAREVSAVYDVSVGWPYYIDSLAYFWANDTIGNILNAIQADSRLKVGDRYDLDLVKAERNRWAQALIDRGFYFASAGDFIFLADTVAGEHEVDLLGMLKDDVPPKNFTRQRLVAVNIFPNYDAEDTTRNRAVPPIRVGGVNVYCEDCPLRPEILDEAFVMQAGDIYSPDKHARTLQRLAAYRTFRYISLSYDEVPGSDSTLILNAYLQPVLRRRIEAEAGITYNNASYVGPNGVLRYTNRNLLRGAELFQLEGDLNYTVYTGNEASARVDRSITYGLTATLNVPRLWLPKRRKLIPRVITSGTVMSVGAKFLNLGLNLVGFTNEIRELNLVDLASQLEEDQAATGSLNLSTLKARYGYTWRRRVTKSHEAYPFSIHAQDPATDSDELIRLATGEGLAQQGGTGSGGGLGASVGASRYDRMIAYSPGYTYTFDSRLAGLKTHNFFWLQYLSMNWNNVFPITGPEQGERISSLYPQVESDVRYYWTVTQGTQVATRVHGGIAYPLSDRAIVPFFDLYTIGGPNSVRGFNPLQLGPGRTVPRGNNQLTTGGFGNVLFETSIELRQRIVPLFELALFYDAGNIWTYKTALEPLDTDFRQENFINELAMNYGVGFRFDLQFLIFRLDIAKPFQLPYEDTARELVIPLRGAVDPPQKDINWIIAFGYPF